MRENIESNPIVVIQPRYLSVQQAAKYASTSTTTIYEWFKKGLPKIKANGTRVDVKDLDEYLSKRKLISYQNEM
ncbi:hypothetical protein DS831_04540 [Bombilactobacillus bombi]|uniref:Helix-turn-helix domain-containing protein n=1 Tax=Bombilactobacillus bombi TaxID=1303590 RepID=A0A3R6XWD4_9LACO|nr:helix-turn-helix domain-containing protein [Bombilactobacillus bombi]RHW51294.1 hypothetical protein DS831_04540 [Bombilactobacillus bombi]